MSIPKLDETAVATIHPISYSFAFDSRVHKGSWHIEFSGDTHALLSGSSGTVLEFTAKQEAEKYVSSRWPGLMNIESIKKTGGLQ